MFWFEKEAEYGFQPACLIVMTHWTLMHKIDKGFIQSADISKHQLTIIKGDSKAPS